VIVSPAPFSTGILVVTSSVQLVLNWHELEVLIENGGFFLQFPKGCFGPDGV
jgi:hypothetical protein